MKKTFWRDLALGAAIFGAVYWPFIYAALALAALLGDDLWTRLWGFAALFGFFIASPVGIATSIYRWFANLRGDDRSAIRTAGDSALLLANGWFVVYFLVVKCVLAP